MADVVVKDRGGRRAVREIGKGGRGIRVGILSAEGGKTKSGGVTVAQVAEWAEFGVGQPRRSWLRDWIDGNEDRIFDRMTFEMLPVFLGEEDVETGLNRIGVWVVGELQANIRDRIPPPNAPSTVAQKGSDVPLINTGQLVSSISYQIETPAETEAAS